MRTICARAGIALSAWLLGGCATSEWVARDAFGDKYSCPADQVTVRRVSPSTSVKGEPMPGFTDLSVGGCGLEAKYRCHNANADRGGTKNVCVENVRFGIQATDGSVTMAMPDDPDAPEAPVRAAIASAAHDIPCPRESLRLVMREPTTVEGCGQRLTYKEEEHALTPPPGYTLDADVKGYRAVLVSRSAAIETAPAPAPAPSASQ
jgi:hypothetical protein